MPDGGAKILCASRPKKKKTKHENRSNIVTNSIKTLKKMFHIKKRIKKNRMYLTKFCKKYYNIERIFTCHRTTCF